MESILATSYRFCIWRLIFPPDVLIYGQVLHQRRLMETTIIHQFVAADAAGDDVSSPSEQLAKLIANKSVSLLAFIQALGPHLTSDDPATRSYALHCFSKTLEKLLGQSELSKQDVSVLIQFLTGKLEDEKLTLRVLQALGVLVQFRGFVCRVNDNLVVLLKAVSEKYEPRKHLAKVRHEAFVLLENVFSHSDDIAADPEFQRLFVKCFIHVASGEKDPRNLLLSFTLNRRINEKLSFTESDQAEVAELFDVCFCYFPISFTPPANDPYKITADQLKQELRLTIASQSLYAEDSFPALFEKLTSTNPAVRSDVMQTLLACVDAYSMESIEKYWITIWDALKFEVLHNSLSVLKPENDYIIEPKAEELDDTDENKVLMYVLKTLSAITLKLSLPQQQALLFETAMGDLKSNFKNVSLKTMKQSTIILAVMSENSPKIFKMTTDFLFLQEIWGKYIRSDMPTPQEDDEIDVAITVASQRDLIDNLGFVFTALKILNEPDLLQEYKAHLLIFMGQLLQTSSRLEKTLKCKITQQLVKLVSVPSFFTNEDVILILTWLNENLSDAVSTDSSWESDILVSEIVKGIVRSMSEGKGEDQLRNVLLVIETILPGLLERASEPAVLSLVTRLCVSYQFLEVLSIRLLNRMADGNNVAGIIDCLIKSFVQTQKVKQFLSNTWYQRFLPQFLSILVNQSESEIAAFELGGRLLGLIVLFVEKAKHQTILDDMIRFFVHGGSFNRITGQKVLDVPTQRITLFKHVIANVDKSTNIYEDTIALIKQCLDTSATASPFARLEYLEVASVLMNKFIAVNSEEAKTLIAQYLENDFECAVWLIKGLIVRNDPLGKEFISKFIEKLLTTDSETSKVYSRSFAVFMSDIDVFSTQFDLKKPISQAQKLNVRLLYKQQLFEELLKSILNSDSASLASKEVILNTLAIAINNVSQSILQPHLASVLPLVLNGLSVRNSIVLEASLSTIAVIINESPELVRPHLPSILPGLVEIVTCRIINDQKQVNNEQARLQALNCIGGLFTKLQVSQVEVYKKATLQQLAAVLDDKRRSVRKKGTDVRQILFELGR